MAGPRSSIGVVRDIDFAKQVMVVETAVPEAEVAAVRIGRHKLR
jgi:polynucleotide 5'-kinase involved in rRNA processing